MKNKRIPCPDPIGLIKVKPNDHVSIVMGDFVHNFVISSGNLVEINERTVDEVRVNNEVVYSRNVIPFPVKH